MTSGNRPSHLSVRNRAEKDKLFDQAKYGHITGEEADAKAIALGLGSLSRTPSAEEFRPEEEAQWTLAMAVAWIAYLDLEEVREWSVPFRAACWDWHWQRWRVGFDGPIHEGWHLEQRSKPNLGLLAISSAYDQVQEERQMNMRVGDAQSALWTALQQGFFAASGISKETGRRLEIPALEWHELVCVQAKDESDEVRLGTLGTGYCDVLIPSASLRGFWRPKASAYDELPQTISPSGDGYMPLYCAAQWIATNGGGFRFEPDDEQIWRKAYDELLSAISSEAVKVVGSRNGRREVVPGYQFAGIIVEYPFCDVSLDTLMSEDFYLQSYPYIDDQHWRGGFDDALMNRRETLWNRLMVEKGTVRSRWPFELGQKADFTLTTGLPGRPSKSKHLIENELQKRASEGRLAPSLKREASELLAWLKDNYPEYPPPTSRTIENGIRDQYRTLNSIK